MRVIVTGGSGFIGSAIVRLILAETGWQVLNLDKLGYAAVGDPCPPGTDASRYDFAEVDLVDRREVGWLVKTFDPDLIIHAAAETHVDRSIDGPEDFIGSNLVATFELLQVARRHWQALPAERQRRFRFHFLSTDEVFGSLAPDEPAFGSSSPLRPNSPYAATKAGAEHLVRAWGRTYGLPVSVTRGSNTLGPYQFPEKLVPLATVNALEGRPIPVYGDGRQRREWLHVEDHARAVLAAATCDTVEACWLVGSGAEHSTLEVVEAVCDAVDRLVPDGAGGSRRQLIVHAADRPGHDRRYALDTAATRAGLVWSPRYDFPAAIEATVRWYIDNRGWWQRIRATRYAGERLGLAV